VRVREERAEAEKSAKRAKPVVKEAPKPAAPARSKNEAARAKKLEAQIEAAEADLAALEEELADPSAWNDPRTAAKSTARHAAAKKRVEELYARYESVAG
jgi:ATP-binding cassette subfamily F protein 3